jgi:hypothetical protein
MEWQPIENAPKDQTRILMAHEELISIGYWYDGDWYCEENPDADLVGGSSIYGEIGEPEACAGKWEVEPTHWMPLPAHPGETP